MNKRVLKVVGLLATLLLVFLIGVVAGGGVTFAATQLRSPDQEQMTLAQETNSEPGVVIASVAADGPAAQAGLERGDILLKINDEALDSPGELIRYLSGLESGDQVELTALHGDEERTLTATLGDRDGQPYLGVVPCGRVPAEPGIVALRMARPGARIIEVVPDSPADQAGLEVGNLIIAVDGQEPDPENSLADLIAAHEPGDTVTLQVMRPGEQESHEVSVQLGEHPEEEGTAYLGVQYLPAPHIHRFEGRGFPPGGPSLRIRPFGDEPLFIFPGDGVERGAVVLRVAEDGPAAAAELQRGDIITAVDGQSIDGPQALADAVASHQPGDAVKLSVYRPQDEETLEIEVTLAEHPDQEGEAYLGVLTAGFFQIQGFDGDYGLPELKDLERRLKLELPFDLQIAPHWFEFQTPPGDCCDAEPGFTV